ncbi:MAG TPA: heme exporter protein CcmB [Candidatus Acidoferrales bacterium]|nr:heme exporter protein CcmB [Candidatus Acidoferrales bacterium]
MNAGRAAAIIVAKEVRAEFRARELLNTTLIFAFVVVVIFSFAFDPTTAESRRFGPGLLWIALLFAGSLMLQPSFAREHANDTLDALCLAPVSPFAILLGKIAANFIFLSACEVLLLPVFAVLYNVALLPVLGRLVIVLMLGTFGLTITGTVFSAVAAQARMRELLLPLLLLPVLVPLLLAAVEATAGLFAETPELQWTWLEILIGFDVMFFTATWLLSDFLLQE